MMFFVSRKKFETEVARRAVAVYDEAIAELEAEMQDDLVQKIAALRPYVDGIGPASIDLEEIEKVAFGMRYVYAQVIRFIRKISELSPFSFTDDRYTVVDELRILCMNVGRATDGEIHFVGTDVVMPVSRHVQTQIVRIVRTLVLNAAGRSPVWVRLQWQPGQLTVEVEEGMDASQVQQAIGKLENDSLLKMRSQAIGTAMEYGPGSKGLLATLRLKGKDAGSI